MPYAAPAASSQWWSLDGVTDPTASPPFPGTLPGVPSNYFIVIDDIAASITANGAGAVKVTIAADDGQTIYVIGKTFAAAESDTFHITFPRGLVLPKLTRQLVSGGRISVPTNATYTSASIFTVSGAPTACYITVNYRYMAPAAIGL